MPAATAIAPRQKTQKKAVQPKKPSVQHFVIVGSGEGECFWSEQAFRKSYYGVVDQVRPGDWVFIDLSKRDEQLDKKSLSELGHIVFDLRQDRKAIIGLVLNEKDWATLVERQMDGFFTIFFSWEQLQMYFDDIHLIFL